MVTEHDNEDRSLYRFSYYEPEDGCTQVEWVWLKDEEVLNYRPDSLSLEYRLATEDEVSLYEEAYSDGYGIAAMLEFQHSYDGVTFRVELGENGELDFDGKKMFECAVCAQHKDFDEEVATVNDMYLGILKDDKLWHVCYSCGLIGTEIGSIEISSDADPAS